MYKHNNTKADAEFQSHNERKNNNCLSIIDRCQHRKY